MAISAVVKDNSIQEIDDNEVDVELGSPSRLVGSHPNLVPLANNALGARIFYASRFVNQSMPLENPEEALVLVEDPETGKSFEEQYGERMGARLWKAPDEGTVKDITPDNIVVTDSKGEDHIVDMYNNFEFNRKTQITNRPVVKVGDKVLPGLVLAASNYTNDKGTLSMGKNARVALLPYRGFSMDDAVVVSESFAKRMTSQHSYESSILKDGLTKFGKAHYTSLFPTKFTKELLANLDEDGMVKPGTTLHYGDPILLATRPKTVNSNAEHLGKLGKIFKTLRSDSAEVWEHHYPGYVTGSVNGRKNAKAFITAKVPLTIGDKLITSRPGQKCFSIDTQLLTTSGWKNVNEITLADNVTALFNTPTGFIAKSVKPITVVALAYDSSKDGELYCYEDDNIAYEVTGNHRVWVKQDNSYTCKLASEIHMQSNICMMSEKFTDISLDPNKFFRKAYKNNVYCVQVPGEGVVLTRLRDKISWNGNSIVSKILPDEQMLRSLDGTPFEVLINPLALPSRVNTATIYELALGKVAAKTGKPIKIPSFNKKGESRLDHALELLKQHGVEPTEEVFDPMTNKKLSQPVTTGMSYIYKLHHVVESKISARGQGAYSQDEQPVKGGGENAQAKRLGGLEVTALLAKGGYANLREASTLRGQANQTYWKTIRLGYKPANPGTPFVFDKFIKLLNGAGMEALNRGNGTLRLKLFTDDDLKAKAPREVKSGSMIKPDSLEGIADGLFDEHMVANNGWGYIKLDEPMLNPAAEPHVLQLLGIKEKDLRAVIAGKMTLEEARRNNK